MKRVLKWVGGVVAVLVLAAAYVWFFQRTGHTDPANPPKAVVASGDKIVDSIRKGAEYLKVYQEADGHFSKGLLDPKPAFTAMVVDALARSPEKYREKDNPWLQKAVECILSYQQEDGSICSKAFPLQTYVTSVSVMALVALENPAHKAAIEKAREFLRTTQNTDIESPNFGGVGYGGAGGKVSGDVAQMMIEALKEAGVKKGDKTFENAEKFFSRIQNNKETNTAPPVQGTEITNDGGFHYAPGRNQSKIKEETDKNGKKLMKSYGLMTYGGLKSFLYMYVDKNDPRVQSAFKWVRENYTLDENRNLGQDGLYYYYLTMAKALSAYGEPVIESPDGTKHNWAEELADKVISLQEADGSWKNKQSKEWMEDDRVLVSAYAIRTLTICHDFLTKQKGSGAGGQGAEEAKGGSDKPAPAAEAKKEEDGEKK
jgi:squalene-hopene/tetraprenyl-beta-curcumene cyclase